MIAIVVLVVLGGGGYLAVTASQGKPGNAPQPTTTPIGKTTSINTGGEVVAEAEVLPIRFAELSLATTGIISQVLVAEGDSVKQGQALLRIDSKRQAAAVTQAQAALDAAKAKQATSQAMLAKAQAALAQLRAGPRAEDIATAAAAVGVAQAELAKAQAGADTTSLATAKANVDKAARAVQQAQFAYDQVKNAPGGANGPQALALEQATINYDLAKITYEQLQQGPRDVDVNVARAQVAQAQAALAQAQTGARPEAIAAAEADVAAAEASTQAAAADVGSSMAALAQSQAALVDTELRAPFDGTVVTLNGKQGEDTPVGTFLVRLADLSQWKVQTKDLTELSVSRVQVGAAVDLTFDAIPDALLTGKVTRIDTFGTNRQGDIVYAVTILPEKLDSRMRWNMTASVRIKTP
jgi:HlyD family secretion protein